MKDLTITAIIKVYQYDELSIDDQKLIKTAMEATARSYAPYSHFSVGAVALLNDGTIVSGTNQENAAYPSGLCAERTTLFYANSQYPDQPVKTLAIAAKTEKDFIQIPIPPCGACRQVILETEKRYGQPIRILLYGKQSIYEVNSICDLLPLSFDSSAMEE
ncbi:cytidine deaminase [Bacteroides sp.]|uniref:cytidine deaminase n=1 Tax=Bacteroides sp. TaxID=29523 RepID=UPI002619DEE7|nr:cytidine deaminase [Bacteroides sp.]MDD3037880.1 cytidine deaminase [Bacteroides sp.]